MRKTFRKRGVISVSLILFLVIGCLVWVFKDYKEEVKRHRETLSFLSDAKDLDRVVDEDVLLTRSFLISNYDSLVWATDTILKLCLNAEAPGGIWSKNPRSFSETGPEYCKAVRKKIDLIEEFKSNNSLLRNYRAYIPTLIDQFQGTPFDENSDHLMIFVFRYFLEQTPGNRGAVERNLTWVDTAAKNPKYAEISSSLRKSVEGLLSSIETRAELEDEIFSGSVRVRYAHLESVYLEEYGRSEARSGKFRIGLLALCALLGCGLVWIVNRLNLATHALSDLNKTLEEKVTARTSELKQASDRLAENQQIVSQSAKMSALGEMAGGVAHEINTPLAAISLYAESLKKSAETLGEAKMVAGLEDIIKTVQRISKIVIGLRRFSRDSSAEKPRPTNVVTVIDDTLTLCREKFRNHGVQLTVEYEDESAMVDCVPEQISQVLLNLLSNSYDAIADFEQKWIKIESRRGEEQYEISVTDCGGGISPEVRAKLMQPFFTTKEIGKGTGLGLSISRGLLEAQHGSLTYDEQCAHTRFVIRLREYDEYRVA